jgi:hypothetical protein
MNPFRKKKTSERKDDPLDAASMEKALAKVDAHHAGIADFWQSIARWERELEEFLSNGDPTNDEHARDAALLRERIAMAPPYLAKAEAKLGPLVETLVGEVLAFEDRLLGAGHQEAIRLNNAIVPVVRPFCNDDAEALQIVSGFSIYRYIPYARRSPLLGISVGEHELFWYLGHESHRFQEVIDGGRLPEAERQVRQRVADLLVAYSIWQGRGNKWVPKDYASPSPAGEPLALPAPAPLSLPEGEPARQA